MEKHELSNMIGGWFVGDFSPSVLRTSDFEVAIKYYKAGDSEAKHVHHKALEITVVASGAICMSGKRYISGEIVVISPGEATDFLAIEDSITVVVKNPSVRGDKIVIS